jgi:hypothetical protein
MLSFSHWIGVAFKARFFFNELCNQKTGFLSRGRKTELERDA